MTPLAHSLAHDVLSLPPLDRAGIIEELLASFDRQSRLGVVLLERLEITVNLAHR